MSTPVPSAERYAADLLDLLVDAGEPLTSAECCSRLGWPKGRFDAAIRLARERLCPPLGFTIPAPTPAGGWRYQVTTDWQPVEEGASYAMGVVRSRLVAVARDVQTVKPHLERGSREWRTANFLDKHLTHILGTLEEINGEG